MKTDLNKEPFCTGWQYSLRRRTIIGLIMLAVLIASGSASPSEEWNRTFGGKGDNYARSILQTRDGGYILSGCTGAFESGDYAWFRKTDIDGLEIWNKTFRRGTINVIYSVQQTQDGYILTGYTGPDYSNSNTWLIKTDPNGNELWNRTYGENAYSWAYSVRQTSDGGYMLAGRMRPQRVSWTEADFDAYLIKTDGNGNEQWNRTLGGKFRDEARSVSKTSDGGYVLAGMTNSYGGYWGDAWLIRTDKDGNEKWNRTYYMSSSIYSDASSVHETSDGGYILAGVIAVNDSGKDAWLIKTDKNGNEQWNWTFGGKDEDYASSVQQTSDGGYFLAGSRGAGTGAQDAWLIKTDAKGNEQWNLTFGGKFNAYSVAQTADGGYILAGDAFSPGADDRVAWLIKVSKDDRNNETEESPVEKAGGFEAALAITILLTLYNTRKR